MKLRPQKLKGLIMKKLLIAFLINVDKKTHKKLCVKCSFERSMQFTLEKSQDNKLPFIIEKKESKFEFTTYRKPTHTNSYIHFFSFHSHEIKMSVIVGLFLRALRICDPHKLDEKINFIKKKQLCRVNISIMVCQ